VKTYKLCLGQSIGYDHPAKEKTAVKSGYGMFGDDIYQVWPSRESMAKAVRRQQKREHRQQDWRPLVPLTDGEGW